MILQSRRLELRVCEHNMSLEVFLEDYLWYKKNELLGEKVGQMYIFIHTKTHTCFMCKGAIWGNGGGGGVLCDKLKSTVKILQDKFPNLGVWWRVLEKLKSKLKNYMIFKPKRTWFPDYLFTLASVGLYQLISLSGKQKRFRRIIWTLNSNNVCLYSKF